MDEKIEKNLKKTLKFHAQGLGIPDGSAEAFIDQTLLSVKKTFRHKPVITEQDLSRAVIKELKKYNTDLAYVYKNYDKII